MGTFARRAAVIALGAFFVFCHAVRQDTPPPKAPNDKLATATAPIDAGAEIVVKAKTEIPAEDPTRWAAIDASVKTAIDAGKMPGCVLVVGRHDEILFERAYGSRAILPERTPMTTETVFDLASLTKPLATATSVMILVERGKLDLDARASTYVPELAKLPPFTVRQLMIHTSGLPAITPMADWSTDRADVMKRIGALTLKAQPGERFNYSDVGFVVLQEIVERTSKETLSTFSAREIFSVLGMKDTGFLPPPEIRARAAPTEVRFGTNNGSADAGFMQGEVHDPRAFALGGVSGNAGLFSTARDMSRFARAMLQRGMLDEKRVFASEKTFERMIARQETSKGGRALGWDLDSSFASHRSTLLSPKAFGHGGYTGTAMWIDPEKDLFVVFLSNRVHPDGKGAVNPLVAEVATLAISTMAVKTGIDVLRGEQFERLRGAHIGLVTNASARTRPAVDPPKPANGIAGAVATTGVAPEKEKDGPTTVEVLRGASGVTLSAIFTPEHGLSGDREGLIADTNYNGVPVYSLYGERFTPTSTSLDGIDTIVFDLQDAGIRFYTYASTMKRAMKIAADKHLRFVVLDRPNPLGGMDVQGPMLAETDVKGFVNHHPLPLRHGMTMGELARLFAEDDKLDVRLDVVRMTGWRRQDTFDHTGLNWFAPSPNLRSMRAVALYPAIGLLESTNVSVGRGTDLPFEIVAAPWLDSKAVAAKLTTVPGVQFDTTEVTPKSSVHANKTCPALKVKITDAARFEPIRTAIAIAEALREVHPTDWDFEGMDKMLRHKAAMSAIRAGKGVTDVEATWASDLATFKEKRERFLLYK